MSDNDYQGWVWKGKKIRTVGELGNALCALESPEEAQEFMRAYQAVNAHAYANVGYVSGYYDRETMVRIQEWCQAAHPLEREYRWQSLLDRIDAQVRESYEADIAHAIGMRDAWMARSHRTRDKGFDADTVRGDVDDARACNWQALRLRRELRALDPTRHIAKDTE